MKGFFFYYFCSEPLVKFNIRAFRQLCGDVKLQVSPGEQTLLSSLECIIRQVHKCDSFQFPLLSLSFCFCFFFQFVTLKVNF